MMKIEIIINRDRKNDGKEHNGVIVFENGPIVTFKIEDSDLLDIHNNYLLKNTHTTGGKNHYQGIFQIVDEE